MDGSNVEPAPCLDDVIRDICFMQTKVCVAEVTCECGAINRVPLDGSGICQGCYRKVVSPLLSGMAD